MLDCQSDQKPVLFMICHARSGGTLLNKALGAHPDIVMLSEVSLNAPSRKSFEAHSNIVPSQAKNWYDIELESKDYIGAIIELKKKCDSLGKTLVIRDWTYSDFPTNETPSYQASHEFSGYQELKEYLPIKPFAFVRDTIDVWLSTQTKMPFFGGVYHGYIRTLLKEGFPIFKYESFCGNPEDSIAEILNLVELEFDEKCLEISSAHKVQGDVSKYGSSRGRGGGKIKVLNRKRRFWGIAKKIDNNEDIMAANQLLDYSSSYGGVQSEAMTDYLSSKLKKFLRSLK